MDREKIRKLTLGEAQDYVGKLAEAEEEDAASLTTEKGGVVEVDGWKTIKNTTDFYCEPCEEQWTPLDREWWWSETAEEGDVKVSQCPKCGREVEAGIYETYQTEDYQLVQHDVYFGRVLDTVEELGFEIAHIKVMDARARVDMEIVPDTPNEFDDERIAMGLRASNSLDGSVAARLQAYGLRLVCSNGMMGRALFGSKAMRHVGENIKVEKIANQIQEILPQAKENLGQVISEAMNTEVVHAPTVLEDVGFGGTYQDEISEMFLGDDRWDLYCSTTSVIEHGHKDVQESTRESLHKKANALLPEVKQ